MKKSRIILLVFIISIASLTVGAFLGGMVPARGLFYPYLGIFSDVLSIIEKEYVDPISTADPLFKGAIRGLISGLDQSSSYLSKEEVEELKHGSSEGRAESGFEYLKFYHFLLVTSVHKGSPAEQAALQPGDQIIKINGKSLRYLSLIQCEQLVRGDPGTALNLSIIKIKNFKKKEIKLILEETDDQGFDCSLKDGNIGYLKIASFHRVHPSQIVHSLKSIEKESCALLIDLRNSSSGNYKTASSFLSLYMEPGPILALMKKGLEEVIINSSRQDYTWTKPIYILIDSRTAGPSEAIASILKEQRQALILGENSFGLALEQELILLEDGSGIILSTKKYRSYKGSSWNKEGIKPDHEFKAPFPLPEDKPDQQLQESLELIRKNHTPIVDKAA